VVSRRIDAQVRADSPWHDLGRALGSQGVAAARAQTAASVWLTEFGDTALTVNNQQVKPRINKTYQLLAYLCANGRHSADGRHGADGQYRADGRYGPDGQYWAHRDELLDVLFDGRADASARAYLRQTVRQLRLLLPADVEVTSQDAQISLSGGLRMGSDSARFTADLAAAARLQGAARLTATLDALALYDRGPYLPKAESAWVDDRRAHLAKAATDARHDAAKLAFDLGRFASARELNNATLDANPYDEAAWQLRMRISGALGDVNAVLDSFRGCERALAELGTTPSRGTRTLLEDLRA
jgi:DNA-binding SARP family transcriptional activator